MNKKIGIQVLCLLACFIMMMVAAIQKNGRIFGQELKMQDTATVAKVETLSAWAEGDYIIHTAPLGKDIIGYAGTTPLDIYVKGGVIERIEALPNEETPDFFDAVQAELLPAWDGKTIEEALAMQVDAVSGATFSSEAVKQNVQAGLTYAQGHAGSTTVDWEAYLSPKFLITLLVVLMAAVLPLFIKSQRYRTVQLWLNVLVLGFWSGSFINYTLMLGYMSNGIRLSSAIVGVLMLVMAFIYPLFGKKNYYCTWTCPLGAAQDLAGKAKWKKWKISNEWTKRLTTFREWLWVAVMGCMWAGVLFEWMEYEAFSAFLFTQASVPVLVLAIVFIGLSFFMPRPYCRFVCPTGTLFKYVQNSKS